MKVELIFEEPLLGTLPGDKAIAKDFVLSKHPEGISKEELMALCDVDEAVVKISTVFARDEEGRPMLWDYQIKGFLKEACEAMIHSGAMTKEELKKYRLTQYLYKKTIDRQVFISPRRLVLQLPDSCDSNKLDFCERPLRGMTMRGERVSLARSEQAPAGTKVVFEISFLNPKLLDFVKQWLTYGALLGAGQWRNSGKGRFSWREIE
jgi:hypothetical protein